MKTEIMSALMEFHKSAIFYWRLKTTLLALIPKRVGASNISDYRPISLISSVYKWLAKLLANRLKQCLPQLISSNQSAFIKGRQILDGVLVANELVDSRVKSKVPGILFKADFEKAYDHINWNFLLWTMGRWASTRNELAGSRDTSYQPVSLFRSMGRLLDSLEVRGG